MRKEGGWKMHKERSLFVNCNYADYVKLNGNWIENVVNLKSMV